MTAAASDASTAGCAPAGRREDIIADVVGEGPEELIRLPVKIEGSGEAFVEALDGFADRVGSFCSLSLCAREAFLLESIDVFELCVGFVADGVDGVFVVDEGFEFELFAVEAAGGFGVVEGEGAFLDQVLAVRSAFAGGANFQREFKAVEFFVWMGQEEGDVFEADFVL